MPQPYANFWQLDAWTDDSKATRLTPASGGIFRIGSGGVRRVRSLNQVPTYDISLILEDHLAGPLAMGNYLEISNGKSSKTLWFACYIDETDKGWSDPSTYALKGSGAMGYLADYRNGDNTYANWGLGYHNVLQRFNGINAVGQPAGTNQKGILPPTWRAKWVDGSFTPAGSTTTTGTNAVNATTIAVASSASINITNRAVKIGSEWYGLDPTNPNPNGTHIKIVAPGLIASVPAGTTVQMAPYMLPGTGQNWYTANDTSLNAVLADCKRYNIHCREGDGSTAHNGILEVGPFRDVSGFQIWGGEQLAAQQARDSITYGHKPDIAHAELIDNLVTIDSALYTNTISHVINTAWPFGHGKGDSARTLKALMGTDPDPLAGSFPSNGWSKYQPYVNDRLFYIKGASATQWNGNTYEYICFQRQDGKFQYGVINRGPNTAANQPPPYGLKETVFKDRNVTDPTLMLEEALGTVEYNADPVPSYTFVCRPPRDGTTGLPTTLPRPGQTVDVRFTGQVNNAVDVSTIIGQTFGQLVDVGPYKTIKFPTVADPTDENGAVDINKVKKMAVCVQEEDVWDDTDTCVVTLTMGRGSWESHHWEELLAKDMEAAHHEKDPFHSFTKHPFHKIPFLFPTGDPAAYEDSSTGDMVVAAGAFVPTDSTHTILFSNGHQVRYTLTGADTAQVIDFIFGKDMDGTHTSLTSSGIYALYRLAFSTSGLTSGFFYRNANSLTVIKRGKTHASPGLLDGNARVANLGTYTVFVTWLDNQLQALVTKGDIDIDPLGNTKYPHPTSHWNDASLVLNKYGAIGFAVTGGSQQVRIRDLDARGYHAVAPPKNSVGRPHVSPTLPLAKARSKTTPDVNGHPIIRIVPV